MMAILPSGCPGAGQGDFVIGYSALMRSARTGEPAPAKAGGTLADLLAVMQTDLRRIEVALREVAIQASFLDAPPAKAA